jgi:hypothetical protein
MQYLRRTFGRQGKMQGYEGEVHSKETHHPTLPCAGPAFLWKSTPAPFAVAIAHVRSPMRLYKTEFQSVSPNGKGNMRSFIGIN